LNELINEYLEKSGSELFEARGAVLKKLFADHGITVNQMTADYNSKYGSRNTPLNVSASASRPVTSITGYDVTTTPIKRKVVNGRPVGRAIPTGQSTSTISSTEPVTGDKYRR